MYKIRIDLVLTFTKRLKADVPFFNSLNFSSPGFTVYRSLKSLHRLSIPYTCRIIGPSQLLLQDDRLKGIFVLVLANFREENHPLNGVH